MSVELRVPETVVDPEKALLALRELVDTVECTGGLVREPAAVSGYAPAADPDWWDLTDAYLAACAALGRVPDLREGEGDDTTEED